MTKTLSDYYKQARAAAGYRAQLALRTAKILERWNAAGDNVRLLAEPEEENYYDVYRLPEAYTDGHGRRVSAEQAREEIDK